MTQQERPDIGQPGIDTSNVAESPRDPSAEERAALARERAAKAERKAAKQRERAARAERKANRADKADEEGLPLKLKLKLTAAAVAAALVAAVVFVGIPIVQAKDNKTTYFTSSELAGIVNVSKLSTAEYRYNGIATKYNGNGDIEYHVYYESTVSATYDMGTIDFTIDNEKRTITPILPEPIIGDPAIDSTSLDYLPKAPNANLRDVITICKEDALAEVEQAGGILYTARQNMKRTIEALLTPLTESSGYTITWPDDASSNDADSNQNNAESANPQQKETENDASQLDAASEEESLTEGGSNE